MSPEAKTILLVDDDESNRVLMKAAFFNARSMHALHFMGSGQAALDYLMQRGADPSAVWPDLIVLDLNMPGKDGFDVLIEIRQHEGLKEIPVVLLTGSNAAADIERCGQFSKCEHILKPSRFVDLVELVKSIETRYLAA